MNTVLKRQDPELYSLVYLIDPTRAHAAARDIALKAIATTGVVSPLIETADTTEKAAIQGARAQLERLASSIEEPYLDALGKDQLISNDSELMHLFRQARAVTALQIALGDSSSGLEDTVYEALHAGLGRDDIKTILTGNSHGQEA